MKILIADDEEIIRSSIDLILKRQGKYETDFALDGEEAIKKVSDNFYDLVLLNLAMPKIDGYTVLKQIRVLYPKLPVVFVTGKGEAPKVAESVAYYKLNGFVEKPYVHKDI